MNANFKAKSSFAVAVSRVAACVMALALIGPVPAQTQGTKVPSSIANNVTTAVEPMTIRADLSAAPQRLLRAEIEIPVKKGPFTFTAVEWIPGNHSPSGPIGDITGIVVTANGRPIPWRSDDIDIYAFHVDVPAGVSRLRIHDEFLALGQGNDIAPNLIALEWERLLLYPAGVPTSEVFVQPIDSAALRTSWPRSSVRPLNELDCFPAVRAVTVIPVGVS